MAFFAAWARFSRSQYVLAISAAYFLMGCGFLVSHVSRNWGALLDFLPGQSLYFAGLLALSSAICMRAGRTVPMHAMLVVSVVAIAFSAFLHSVGTLAVERLAITNLGQGSIFALAAWTIRPKLGNESSTDVAIYWIVLLTGAQFFIRPISCYLIEGRVGLEELRGSVYWAVTNATVIAFSLLLAISLAVAIASEIIDELRKRKNTADASDTNPHKRAIKSVLTKEEIEMLLER